MRISNVIVFGLISLMPLMGFGCRHRSDDRSDVKSQDSCNLREMEKASYEASAAALSCAHRSMKQAGLLMTGAVAKNIAQVFIALDDFRLGAEGAGSLFTDLRAYLLDPEAAKESNATPVKNLVEVITAVEKYEEITNPELARTAMYKCLRGQYNNTRNLYAFVTLATTMKNEGRLSAAQIYDITRLGLHSTSTLLSSMSRTLECSNWLGQKRLLSNQRMLNAINRLREPIDVLIVLAQCGVDLAKGGYVLYKNTQCLVEDLDQYYKSREGLENARDHYVQNVNVPIHDELRGRNACMAKYGIFLSKQSFYSYLYRSRACGDYCGNGSTANVYFQTNLSEIFPMANDYEWCRENASASSSEEAVRYCAVYCCDQDNNCANAAMTRAGF